MGVLKKKVGALGIVSPERQVADAKRCFDCLPDNILSMSYVTMNSLDSKSNIVILADAVVLEEFDSLPPYSLHEQMTCLRFPIRPDDCRALRLSRHLLRGMRS